MVEIKFDKDTVWSQSKKDQSSIYLSGTLFFDNKKLDGKELIDKLNLLSSNQRVRSFANKAEGQFSFIFENDEVILAYVDKIRSFPILSYTNNNTLFLSNSIKHFETVKSNYSINENAMLAFEMSGYTLGNETLYKGLQSIEQGSFLLYKKRKKTIYKEQYYSFFSEENSKSSASKLIDDLNNVVDQSISRLIDIADGRKIILPLSAGLDSRLILGKLIELGYDNILCYTYGSQNIWEREIAEKTALKLGVEWIFLDLTKSKKKYHSDERRSYFDKMCYYISVPHLADFYSLQILKNDHKIKLDDCVIVNGQTGDFISGAHIPKGLGNLSKDELLEYIIDKHFSLWTDLKTEINKEQVKNRLLNLYNFEQCDEKNELCYKFYEKLECDERQIKYVINGQRAYDWYYMNWYLPLWSDEMLDFWREIKLDLKLGQNLYKEYCLKYNPSQVFDIQLTKNTHSLAWYLFPFLVLIKFLSLMNKRNSYSTLKKRYLSYFEKYMPFYPHLSYLKYLKEAKNHRNPVSFWVRTYLKEKNFKRL